MRKSRFGAALAAVGAGALTLLAAPSAANADALTEIRLRQSGVLAASYDSQSCDQIPGGQPLSNRDGWVFVLPGNRGEFVSIDLVFKRPNGSLRAVHISNPADAYPDGILAGPGTSKAYVITPEGWTLVSGTAMITGSTPRNLFNLTHACPSTGGYPSYPSYPSS